MIRNHNMVYSLNYEAEATQAPLIRLLQCKLENPLSYIVRNNIAAFRKPSSIFSVMSLTTELLHLCM